MTIRLIRLASAPGIAQLEPARNLAGAMPCHTHS
jgi:hypothetical protein